MHRKISPVEADLYIAHWAAAAPEVTAEAEEPIAAVLAEVRPRTRAGVGWGSTGQSDLGWDTLDVSLSRAIHATGDEVIVRQTGGSVRVFVERVGAEDAMR